MKPFITEQQLALMKYQPNSKYFEQSMAYIAREEFEAFCMIKPIDWNIEHPMKFFDFFLNKRIKEDLWEIYFYDNSILSIKLSLDEDNEKIFYFGVTTFGHIDSFSGC